MTPDYDKIPVDYMRAGVRHYIEDGQRFGDFLTALFDNDLRSAIVRADQNNLAALRQWVQWLHWEAPSECHGSPEKTKAWRETGGRQGIKPPADSPEEAA